MAKRDVEYTARLQGMEYMLKYIKENGLDAGELELKKRGYTRIPLGIPSSQVDKILREMSDNVYTMMLVGMLYTLNQEFGFGKDRLNRVKNAFDKIVKETGDLDYMCQHYVSMMDYAHEIADRYGIELDVDKVKYLTETYDKGEDTFRMCKIDRVIEVLESDGFPDAAKYIKSKLI